MAMVDEATDECGRRMREHFSEGFRRVTAPVRGLELRSSLRRDPMHLRRSVLKPVAKPVFFRLFPP